MDTRPTREQARNLQTRLSIVAYLRRQGGTTATQVARQFDMNVADAAFHLRVLVREHQVTTINSSRRGQSAVVYLAA